LAITLLLSSTVADIYAAQCVCEFVVNRASAWRLPRVKHRLATRTVGKMRTNSTGVVTFLEFMEMSGNLAKVREKAQSQGKVRKFVKSLKLDCGPAQRNNLPVLYSYCNSFFVRDVRGEFGLINVHSFDILPAISSRKV